MSSARFPGKVLAPLAGRPLLWHVVDRVANALSRDAIVVLTSVDPTDDPVAAYADYLGVQVFRGDLDDVFARFRACLLTHPCEWFLRVCGDSPLIEPPLISSVRDRISSELGADLVTNVFPRTFPRGQSVEFVNSASFASVDRSTLTPEQKEHVTRALYDHPERFSIVNVESEDRSLGATSWVVDTLEDLRALESRLAAGETFRWTAQRARAG
jgi:spore coat polysaccharide biosynthesis protein SpsF